MGEMIQQRMIDRGVMRKTDAERMWMFSPLPKFRPQVAWMRQFLSPSMGWYTKRNHVIQDRRNKGKTHKQIGAEFDISSSRVGQILAKNKRREIT